MQDIEAGILLENLLGRIATNEAGGKHLPGLLTDKEIQALRSAGERLRALTGPREVHLVPPADPVVAEVRRISDAISSVNLDLSSLSLPPSAGIRLCLDFGTAMSKATLVQDGEIEQIKVLELGKPGDQEEVSPVMLISSVYIDVEGRLWFGKKAVDRSLIGAADGTHQRLDNIKRRLSEDGLDEAVTERFNPTPTPVTYGDMVLAYLTFLTWAVNKSLAEMGHPANVQRRFAMPCLPNDKSRETAHRLRKLLGEAQILADTFTNSFENGIPLTEFVAAVARLRSSPRNYSFVAEDLTEPLGVAGALLSWKSRVDMLVMVVDVGAGTSDMSLYRILVDPTRDANQANEVVGSARGITEAGNYLDRILVEFILKKAGVSSGHPRWISTRAKLELNIRDYKETLFNDGFVFISVDGLDEIQIELDEFRNLDAVNRFGASLRDTMQQILESVDPSFVDWVQANPQRYLTVALTGGGASLPMVQELAKGTMMVNGKAVRLATALAFPMWLRDDYPDLEQDFARIAVSLGGARQRLVRRGADATITGGDVTQTPKLGGFYLKGG